MPPVIRAEICGAFSWLLPSHRFKPASPLVLGQSRGGARAMDLMWCLPRAQVEAWGLGWLVRGALGDFPGCFVRASRCFRVTPLCPEQNAPPFARPHPPALPNINNLSLPSPGPPPLNSSAILTLLFRTRGLVANRRNGGAPV